MIDPPVPKARLLRFGAMELNPRAGELRKHGIRLRLGEQPFKILLMLLDQPGEIVTREDIRQRLWPNNTIVEFDHSINAAIRRLRAALGETAGKFQHIETVGSRGYRFVGEVIVCDPPVNTALPESAGPEAPALVKDPDARWQSTVDLRGELAWAARKRLWTRGRKAAAMVAASAALFLAGIFAAGQPAADISHVRFTPLAMEPGYNMYPVWSPDGRSFAYMHNA